MKDQLQSILTSLTALGLRKLSILGATAVLLLAMIGFGAYYMNRPAFETLYVGLDRDDVNRIGIVLSDAGIAYDIDSSGTTVLVETGSTSRARMILAEKELPGSSGAGYELFDNLGSLGLTSFMQEVTLVRALEGEIARTIQGISGVKAARVHVVMPDRNGFRGRDRKPTASVLLRSNGSDLKGKAYAIRHLVAAGVPGLTSDNVTILDASGELLAAGQDPMVNALNGSIDIEHNVESELERNIADALGPHLGSDNYRVSVRADIDTDQRQIEETVYDPESRVERSVQVVKTQDKASQQSTVDSASVESAIPETAPATTTTSPASSEERERREETTNYEINSKRIATVSNGYRVKRLSIAIVLNKDRITQILGGSPTQAEIDQRLDELKKVASVAAGMSEKRGDAITVAAVEFQSDQMLGAAEPSLMESLGAYANTGINALAFIIVSVLVLVLGVRPLIRALGGQAEAEMPQTDNILDMPGMDDVALGEMPSLGDMPGLGSEVPTDVSDDGSFQSYSSFGPSRDEYLAEVIGQTERSPQERLEIMADHDDARTAQVLRRWIAAEAA